MKSTVLELRRELEIYKSRSSLDQSHNQSNLDARICIREEVMKHMENMVKDNKAMRENDLKECIGYLEANHGTLSENRRTMIRNSIKTLIDKLLPDFVKCVFLRSEEKVEFEGEELTKLMRSSKYQYNEMVKNKEVGDWEKCMVLMDLNKEQRQKMSELKIFAQKSRTNFTK